MTKTTVERRKHKRFLIPKNKSAFVELRPPDNGMGRLIDISMGGLTFDYVATQRPSVKPTELNIFVANSGFRLSGIPIRSVWDLHTYEIPTTPLHRRQCGVEFGHLTSYQKLQIESFIENHTVVAQCESDPEIYVLLSKK
jgi:hypothetical protein